MEDWSELCLDSDVEVHTLAVAKPVIEDDDVSYIPKAIEYSPDAKPPMYRNRRFRLYGLLAVVMVLMFLLAYLIPTNINRDRNKSNSDSVILIPGEGGSDSSETMTNLTIYKNIEQVVGRSKLSDPTSSHYQALQWILHEDPMQLDEYAENLLQRYILAVFYLSTIEQAPWQSCNPPLLANETYHCDFLQVANLNDLTFKPVPSVRWLSEQHECRWAGVVCSYNYTVALELTGMGLSGPFPEDVAYLPYLQYLRFFLNDLTGTLPSSFPARTKHLYSVELGLNLLTGTIPPQWLHFESLIVMDLSSNQLTGSIPKVTPTMADLKGLYLYETDLDGTIPTELVELTNLNYIYLTSTYIEGEIPSEIGRLTDLKELFMEKTKLQGTIPSEIGLLTQLSHLRLFKTRIGSSLPDELYDCQDLVRVDLSDCQFTGTISTRIGLLSSLMALRLADNSFSGQLPSELGLLSELEMIHINYNDFVGTMPEGICHLRNQSIIYIVEADCWDSEVLGAAPVQCEPSCCTHCCNQAGECIALEDSP